MGGLFVFRAADADEELGVQVFKNAPLPFKLFEAPKASVTDVRFNVADSSRLRGTYDPELDNSRDGLPLLFKQVKPFAFNFNSVAPPVYCVFHCVDILLFLFQCVIPGTR